MNSFIQNDRGELVEATNLSSSTLLTVKYEDLLQDLDKVFDMVEFIGHDACIETCIDIMRARGIPEVEISEIISLIEYGRES